MKGEKRNNQKEKLASTLFLSVIHSLSPPNDKFMITSSSKGGRISDKKIAVIRTIKR